jgi:hypothetical protein
MKQCRAGEGRGGEIDAGRARLVQCRGVWVVVVAWRGGRERGEEDETRATAREGERTEEAARDGWGRGTPRFSFDCCPPSPPLFCPPRFRIQGHVSKWGFLGRICPCRVRGHVSILFPYLPTRVCDGFGKLSGSVVGGFRFSEENHGQERGERDGNCRFRLLFVNISCFDVGSICRS